jgi:hypothetical protein
MTRIYQTKYQKIQVLQALLRDHLDHHDLLHLASNDPLASLNILMHYKVYDQTEYVGFSKMTIIINVGLPSMAGIHL